MLFTRRMLLVTCTLAAACALLVACGGGATPAAVSIAPSGSPESATVANVTGVSEVDRIIDAVQRGDVIKLAELTLYSKLPCTKQPATPEKIGDPPACTADESDGTRVEALAVTICNGGWARPEQAVASYRAALAGGPALVTAVYVPTASDGPLGASLHEQYVVVVRSQDQAGGAKNVALHITGGRVGWVELACPADADLASSDRVQSFLLAPTPSPSTAATAAPQPTQ